MDSLKNAPIETSQLRQMITQIIFIGIVVSNAFMMWKGLMLVTNSESPIVVILTGGMEPSFYRGDILFVNWDYTNPSPGDIVVYKVPSQEIPIVRRVISVQPT